MTCPYITSIDLPCGRPATSGQHCDFHALLAQLDDFDFHDPAPIVVPGSLRPMVDRILSDVQANFDAMPRPPEDGNWFRWNQSPVVHLNGDDR